MLKWITLCICIYILLYVCRQYRFLEVKFPAQRVSADVVRHCQSVLENGCTNLHSCQPRVRMLVCLPVNRMCCLLVNFLQSNRWEKVCKLSVSFLCISLIMVDWFGLFFSCLRTILYLFVNWVFFIFLSCSFSFIPQVLRVFYVLKWTSPLRYMLQVLFLSFVGYFWPFKFYNIVLNTCLSHTWKTLTLLQCQGKENLF